MVISFEQALSTIREKLGETDPACGIGTETLPLGEVRGRYLARDVLADRDFPPFNRSTRDGYALRSPDAGSAPALLDCLGEARAGEHFTGEVGPGQCVRIMTGAPLPSGADAVVMVEYALAEGTRVEVTRRVAAWENVVRQGSEAPAGSVILRRGRPLGAAEIGLLASVGQASVEAARRPRVAILTTGDEVVPVGHQPSWFQVRNSNGPILAALVASASAHPCELPAAPDDEKVLRRLIEQGLEADVLLVSGGVSVGDYDFVSGVLGGLGAEVFFRGVAIRPGKPLMFGRVRGKLFFGLPGNPVSTFVTFELFVRPALARLQGAALDGPLFLRARLGTSVHQKPDLTVFVPARVEFQASDPVVNPTPWQGSGDLVGLAAANCFLVVHPGEAVLAAGECVDVLPRWDRA